MISQNTDNLQCHMSYRKNQNVSRILWDTNADDKINENSTVLIEMIDCETGVATPCFYESKAGTKFIACAHSEKNGILSVIISPNNYGMIGRGTKPVRLVRDFHTSLLKIDENLLQDFTYGVLLSMTSTMACSYDAG